jgi:hypothetical protein
MEYKNVGNKSYLNELLRLFDHFHNFDEFLITDEHARSHFICLIIIIRYWRCIFTETFSLKGNKTLCQSMILSFLTEN